MRARPVWLHHILHSSIADLRICNAPEQKCRPRDDSGLKSSPLQSSRVEIYKEFKFEAAHRLINVPASHKCARLHGHSYRVRVYLEGPLDPQTGWVMDFADLKKVCKPLIEQLDHSYLNDIEGLEQSTAERIAIWFWDRLKPSLPLLTRIEVRETATSGAIYRGVS